MLASTKIIKKTAKTVLREKIPVSLAVSTVIMSVQIVFLYMCSTLSTVIGSAAATFLFVLLEILIVSPLFLSALRFFRRLQWGTEDKVISVFEIFANKGFYKRALRFTFSVALRIFGIALLLFIPYTFFRLLTSNAFYEQLGLAMPVWAANFELVPVFLRTIADVALFFIMLRYYLAPFLFVADEEMEPAEALITSKIISRRTSFDYFSLILSFIPLILLSVFIMPLLFTMPYFIMAYLVHCRFAVAQYNSVLDGLNNKTPSYSADF